MAQAIVLEAGVVPDVSSDIQLIDGQTASIGIFTNVPVSGLPFTMIVRIVMRTPGLDVEVAYLNREKPVQVITGPGVFRVRRPNTSIPVGVFVDT